MAKSHLTPVLYITKCANVMGAGYKVEVPGFDDMHYVGYSKREALRRYREHTGLKYKHLEVIEF